MEVTGGHVYYLLDLDPGDIDLDLDHPKSLPRHHGKPLTNHVANDGAVETFVLMLGDSLLPDHEEGAPHMTLEGVIVERNLLLLTALYSVLHDVYA